MRTASVRISARLHARALKRAKEDRRPVAAVYELALLAYLAEQENGLGIPDRVARIRAELDAIEERTRWR